LLPQEFYLDWCRVCGTEEVSSMLSFYSRKNCSGPGRSILHCTAKFFREGPHRTFPQSCGSWIRIFSIPDPGSKIFPDPGSASTSKNVSILTKKIRYFEAFRNMIRDVHPGSGA
jgi:hypothetical protein